MKKKLVCCRADSEVHLDVSTIAKGVGKQSVEVKSRGRCSVPELMFADTKLLGEEKNARAASHQELVKMKDRQGDISCDSTAPVSSL